ncbi:acyl-CoA N-acyltransferase [Hypoxylon trugodes]|uniref:acyl-CoA N-acyltransferase n=1 Tax=Hypoxylon trugodes TaxID=326681 RepID=UPI0021997639|nr:acyl-CoA N-acyltransferase [Hypoxylon trugodes]KAI1391723.1 acyl-CoA N-acyltransferase [Hypoxylon trugodes]
MSFKLRNATPSDIPTIIDVFFDTFGDHPVTQLVFRSRREDVQKFFVGSPEDKPDPSTHFLVLTDPNAADPDKPFAFCKWFERPKPAGNPSPPPSWPEDADQACVEECFGTIEKKHKEIMGDRPHWYLDILGVLSEYQGKGAGKQLLRWGVEKADDEKIEAFVVSSPAGAPLYAKYGFETLQTALVGNGTRLESFMRRPITTS